MSSSDEDERTLCKYGDSCYQKNPQHHRRFKHPKRKSEYIAENVEKKIKTQAYLIEKAIEDCKNIGNEDITEGSLNESVHSKKKVEDIAENVEQKKKTDVYSSETTIEDSENIRNEDVPKDSLNGSDHNDKCSFINISSIEDIKHKLETVFLVKMPNDFFSFFDFCESLDKNNPKQALTAAGLSLVGPFDLITQDFGMIDPTAALCHYRYFFDPPEFQTVLKCYDKNLLHYGYFRDDPKEEPVFVASNEANVGCTLNIISENLFSAVDMHLDKIKKITDPFKKIKIKKIQDALQAWCSKNGFILSSLTKKMRGRRSKVVAKTFHGAGIVVPYDKKTEVGYRELKENDVTLKKMLKNLVEAETVEERKQLWGKLQPVLTYASIANDECDFGTGLELGIDLFCFGHELFHKAVLQILTTSYNLLGRNEFSTILTAHLKNRRKGEICTLAM
ncbi:histone PARylation factor 1 [Halyomorpha halys]|uniref:histone PARylation factor 1 n=1 Tax=Halyomorpha halys TaxID=286706 RepID=UPI0006D5136A|nr:histone PARylation factor 1 [Halyomorpha halys]